MENLRGVLLQNLILFGETHQHINPKSFEGLKNALDDSFLVTSPPLFLL